MKKLLFMVPIVVLLAAGCNSASPTSTDNSGDNSNQAPQATTNPTPTPTPVPSGMMMDNGTMWQGTLKASDNSAKGNYMLISGDHTIYLKTSRDYSALVGKTVSVSYSGTMDSFTLGDIMAK